MSTSASAAATATSAAPVVGEPAPDFSLPSTAGGRFTLAGARGREAVLLAFFPLAFTSTCTEEVCAFSEDYDAFVERGVRVLPISVDSIDTLREYKAKYGLGVDLLSDFHRTVSRLYDVLNVERFYSNRSYFLIDRDGVLRWKQVEAHNGLRRENAELLEQIALIG